MERPMRMTFPALLLLFTTSSATLAQSDAEVAAYKKGFQAGIAACRSDPFCGRWPSIGGGSGGGGFSQNIGIGAGNRSGYEVPKSLFGGTSSKNVAIPDNWYVAPMQSGQGLVGKVDPDGTFIPFAYDANGSFEFLPKEELPLWAVDPNFSKTIASWPRRADGFVVVPVQPYQAGAVE
jgi:hypothetical protein